ncbi:MAG: hypothetical protein IT376_19775 [Polyangiaceae bacterium]|nr:hypothetical protein [Polyangiaceae bacterium]
MIELKLHRDLYARAAVDAAVAAFGDYAQVDLEPRDDAYVLRCAAVGDTDEAQLVLELGNFALGLTIEGRGSSGG